MRLSDKYQTVDEIIKSVFSHSDIEELKMYINTCLPEDEASAHHLTACKKALAVYEQGFYKRWSTPFLQVKLEECRQQKDARSATVYETEIRSRKT